MHFVIMNVNVGEDKRINGDISDDRKVLKVLEEEPQITAKELSERL